MVADVVSAPRRSVLLLGAAAVALVFATQVWRQHLLVDDAFVTFRYAENLTRHGELVFNQGQRVEGFSSLLFTLMLALGSLAGIVPEVLAPVAGVVAGLGSLALVYRVVRKRLGGSAVVAFTATCWLASSLSFSFWAGAGLETSLFAALLLACWDALVAEPRSGRSGSTRLLALVALLVVTRPEGALVALLLPLLGWVERLPRRRLLVLLGGAVLIVALTVVWRRAYFGVWLPTPVQAKATLTMAAMERGFRYVGTFLWDEALLLLLPVLLSAGRSRKLASLAWLLVAYLALIVGAGGDGLYRYRFLAHVSPLIALLLAACLQRLTETRRRWLPAVLVLVATSAVLPNLQAAFFRGHTLAEVREWEERWSLVGLALAETTPPDALIATNVVGRLPYASQRPTLDLLGLTEPAIAAQPVRDLGRGYAGHERAAPAYVLERAPDVIYFSVLDGSRGDVFRDLQRLQARLAAGSLYRYAALLGDTRFRQLYLPASLKLANGFSAGVFVRADRFRAWRSRRWVVSHWVESDL